MQTIVTNNLQSSQSSSTPQNAVIRKWWVLLSTGMGMFLYALDVYVVSIALPTLGQSFHPSFATLQWVVLSYLLMVTSLSLGAARMGDIWNKKWLYFGGLLLFTISSLLCGLAPTIGCLIAFRAMQGLGAVFITAIAPAIVAEVFPEQERGRALGILWSIFTLGIAMGPGIGGLLIAHWNWHLVFLINVPIGLIACLIVLLAVPTSPRSAHPQRFDFLGTTLISLTLMCFALLNNQIQDGKFGTSTEWCLLSSTIVGFIGFLLVEARSSHPMLKLSLFRDLELSLGLLLAMLVMMVIVAADFILPFFLELVKHYPPRKAGLLLMVFPIVDAMIAPVAGMLSDRLKPRIVSFIGLLLLLWGCWGISTFDTNLTVPGYVIRVIPFGLGLGMFLTPNSSAIMGAVSQEELGIASGIISLSRALGLTTGLSVLGSLFSCVTVAQTSLTSEQVIDAPVDSLVFGAQSTFQIALGILLTATLLATVLWWLEQRRSKTCALSNCS